MTTFLPNRFVNPHQVGGVEPVTLESGVRALLVNTGGGLRYRVLLDRGLDIDQAFFNAHSLAFLTHRGPVAPSQGHGRGSEWLKSFAGGLLTSCGPFNAGAPATDQGDELPLHGAHSSTPASLESMVQPDPRRGRNDMAITGLIRYGQLYGPCVELRRTICSELGANMISVTDEFINVGNAPAPHAWLLHCNFGYPLLDEGAKFCYDAAGAEPRSDAESQRLFGPGVDYRRVSAPRDDHAGDGHGFAYLHLRPSDAAGNVTVALVNAKLALGVALHYNVNEFPRCGNWQHWGRYEYVAALEPMNCGVEGRDKDRQRGWLVMLQPGQTQSYHYRFEVVTERAALEKLLRLNPTL